MLDLALDRKPPESQNSGENHSRVVYRLRLETREIARLPRACCRVMYFNCNLILKVQRGFVAWLPVLLSSEKRRYRPEPFPRT